MIASPRYDHGRTRPHGPDPFDRPHYLTALVSGGMTSSPETSPGPSIVRRKPSSCSDKGGSHSLRCSPTPPRSAPSIRRTPSGRGRPRRARCGRDKAVEFFVSSPNAFAPGLPRRRTVPRCGRSAPRGPDRHNRRPPWHCIGQHALQLGQGDAVKPQPIGIGLDLVAADGPAPTGNVHDPRHAAELAFQHPVLQGLEIVEGVDVAAVGVLGGPQPVTGRSRPWVTRGKSAESRPAAAVASIAGD